MKLKAMQMGIWSVWLSGFVLIAVSLYATRILSFSLKDQITVPKSHGRSFESDSAAPKIILFSAPLPFNGTIGDRQSLAVRSWLALSSQISVVLFSQDPSVLSFSKAFGSRVLVDSHIDFTFLGTPFFHSMIARCQAYISDISVLLDPDSILLLDFISTLNHAHKLDQEWLLVASTVGISHFSFSLDEIGNHWRQANGKRVKLKQLQEAVSRKSQLNSTVGRIIMAWNNVDEPLHCGITPPFLYRKGMHDEWIIHEALSCEMRLVFDASRTISSFFLNDFEGNERDGNKSVTKTRNWEYAGNSRLGQLYGSLYFREISNFVLPKLLKCGSKYMFLENRNETERTLLGEQMIRSWRNRRLKSCFERTNPQSLFLDNYLLKDRLKGRRQQQFDLPFPLESLLGLVANKNQTVVLAVAGYSYKDMLMSWVCRLRQLAVTNFIVCALDEETYRFSILQGLPVFADPSAPKNTSFNDCHFGTKCFQRVTKVKSRIVLKILKLGYNVLLSDVDVYWFRNPLPLLESFGSAVLVAQSDEFNQTGPINLPRRLNSGFYFARSDGPTIAAVRKVVKHAATSSLSEQPSFYDTLCGEGGSRRVGHDECREPETNLTIRFLDRNLFPNGAYLDLWQNKNVKSACHEIGCFVLHNNWINSRLKKLERQVSSGLWEYDTGTRMCLQR